MPPGEVRQIRQYPVKEPEEAVSAALPGPFHATPARSHAALHTAGRQPHRQAITGAVLPVITGVPLRVTAEVPLQVMTGVQPQATTGEQIQAITDVQLQAITEAVLRATTGVPLLPDPPAIQEGQEAAALQAEAAEDRQSQDSNH